MTLISEPSGLWNSESLALWSERSEPLNPRGARSRVVDSEGGGEAKRIAFLLILNLVLLPAVLLSSRVGRLTENVWAVKIGECYLDYHTSIHAVALACPSVDYMRLWPLPVVQPWQETPDPFPEGLPGVYAGGQDPG